MMKFVISCVRGRSGILFLVSSSDFIFDKKIKLYREPDKKDIANDPTYLFYK